MNKTDKFGIDNKIWESVGDSLIHLVISENLKIIPKLIKGHYGANYIKSNENLSSIRNSVPIRVRVDSNHTSVSRLNERKGDEVEYYIAFLYFNFGIECAKRFIFNKIISIHIKL